MHRGVVAAGLAGLGLVGGVGAVGCGGDGGDTKPITDGQGRTESVEVEKVEGREFTCPDAINARLEASDKELARINITLRRLEKSMDAIDKRYPGNDAPRAIADQYDRLDKQRRRLVRVYNERANQANAMIDANCEPDP